MAYPTIVYNASTGSDTLASGAGPSSALTGTSADASATTVIDLDGTPDLSGVDATGLDVLFLATAGGSRKLYKIVGVNDGADQVTIDQSVSVTAVNWAIGGKRLTLEADTSNPDIDDLRSGWIMELEAGTYTMTVTSTIATGDTTDGPVTIQAASAASPIIDGTNSINTLTITVGLVKLLGDLTIRADANRECIRSNGDNKFHLFGTTLDYSDTGAIGLAATDNVKGSFTNVHFSGGANGTDGYQQVGSDRVNIHFENCTFDGGDRGIELASVSSFSSMSVNGCVFDSQDAEGISFTGSSLYNVSIQRSTFYGAGADGITSSVLSVAQLVTVRNCIFEANGGYGIDAAANSDFTWDVDYNADYNNTSGVYNNLTAGANDVNLSGSAFTNAASDDFSLNNTAGQGADCRAAGFPGALTSHGTGFADIGALQHQDAGGGSASGVRNPTGGPIA